MLVVGNGAVVGANRLFVSITCCIVGNNEIYTGSFEIGVCMLIVEIVGGT